MHYFDKVDVLQPNISTNTADVSPQFSVTQDRSHPPHPTPPHHKPPQPPNPGESDSSWPKPNVKLQHPVEPHYL